MKDKKEFITLLTIFLFILILRLTFTFSSTNFISDTSYANLEQVKTILETGHPSSYYIFGGNPLITSLPIFPYLLSLFTLIMPLNLVGKLFPQILAPSLSLIVYFISYNILKNKKISYVNAIIAGTLPIFIKSTINSVLPDSITIPLFFLSLFFISNIHKNKKYITYFLISLIILMLSSTLAIILALSLILYLILVRNTHLKDNPIEIELILFSSFIIIWFFIIFFKNIFLIHGYSTIWQNTPLPILQNYFKDIGFLESVYAIGIIPLIAGIIVIYKYLIHSHRKSIYLFSSVILITFTLMWFRLVKTTEALTLLGVSLVILSGQAYLDFRNFLTNTKFPLKKTVLTFLTISLLLFSFIPTTFYLQNSLSQSFSQKEIDSMYWLKENTPKDAIIASNYLEGQLIESIAERNILIHQNFFLFPDPDARLTAHNLILSSSFSTNALRESIKYGVDYIYFSPISQEYFNQNQIPYIIDSCFEEVYNDGVQIYKIKCII